MPPKKFKSDRMNKKKEAENRARAKLEALKTAKKKEVEAREKAKARAKPKKIPPFDNSKSKGFTADGRGNTTSNPSKSKRRQDLTAGKYIITPDTGDFVLKKPRADKGRVRGVNDGRSRRSSVSALPDSLYGRSDGKQEGLRARAGGVRAFGNTLSTSVGAEPVGGWNGSVSSILTGSGSGATSKSGSVRENIKKKKQDLTFKVSKLDHPDSDPENWSNAVLDDLAIKRMVGKFGMDRDKADINWVNKTEQEKVHWRAEELKSARLEYKLKKQTIEDEIKEISELESEFDDAVFEEQGVGYTTGGGPIRRDAISAPERARKQFGVKIDMMREFGQLDDDTAEGKGRLFEMIDEATLSGALPPRNPRTPTGDETIRTYKIITPKMAPQSGEQNKYSFNRSNIRR